jgi:hypothetical protein
LAAGKHADELAKAHDGYLPTKEVHAKIKEMEDRYDTTCKAWEAAKTEATKWKEKYSVFELKMKKEQDAIESTITKVQSRHDSLEKVILEHYRRILGK